MQKHLSTAPTTDVSIFLGQNHVLNVQQTQQTLLSVLRWCLNCSYLTSLTFPFGRNKTLTILLCLAVCDHCYGFFKALTIVNKSWHPIKSKETDFQRNNRPQNFTNVKHVMLILFCCKAGFERCHTYCHTYLYIYIHINIPSSRSDSHK